MEIVIESRHKAGERLMSTTRGPQVKALVSIGRPGGKLPAGYHRIINPKLRLELLDLEVPGFNGSPEARHVEHLLEWGQRVDWDQPGVCLVHCEMGISRSSACAAILTARYINKDDDVDRAIAELKPKFRQIEPNTLLVQLFKDLKAASIT